MALNNNQKLLLGITSLLIFLNFCAYFSFFEKKQIDPNAQNRKILQIEQTPNPAELFEKEQAQKELQTKNKNKISATVLSQQKTQKNVAPAAADTIKEVIPLIEQKALSESKAITAIKLENLFIQLGLVNIQEYDNSIIVNLKYGTTNNFTQTDLYSGLKNAYCQLEVAKKLSKAQEYLKEQNPHLSLLVLDAARPQSVQETMWEIVKNTPNQKYVAPPSQGSLHSYGAAIDLTIVDANGKELDMGTPYDSFTDLAQPRYEKKMVANGKLKTNQLNNRLLLREVMKKAGFAALENEWWHFNTCDLKTAKAKFKCIQ